MRLTNFSTIAAKTSGVALLAAAIPACFIQGAQAAPTGSWTDLGSKRVYYQSEYRTHTVTSAGGDFKACITTSASSKELYTLYEQDAEVYNAKPVATVKGAGCWVFRDIGDFTDGYNHLAEFYVGSEDNEMTRVHYYD